MQNKSNLIHYNVQNSVLQMLLEILTWNKQWQSHMHFLTAIVSVQNKKAQLSLTNPRDACEKFARFT